MEMGFVNNSEQEKLYNELVSKYEFDNAQKDQIRYGLKKGLDVTLYAKSEFDWAQMEEIRFGLENKVNVSIYAKPEFTWGQMREIRCGLESKIDYTIYANSGFDRGQMYEIRIGIEKDLDVSCYSTFEFEYRQMLQIRLGFEEAGFKNVFSVEYNQQIAKTYQRNFPQNKLIVADIKTLNDEEILKLSEGKKIDVIIGGPPCQGFSLAGNIGRTFVGDERNYLFKEFVRVVSLLKPSVFVMENVARMASHNKGKTIREVKKSFEDIGYKVQYQVLQAADYGVPQKRQRIFVVGTLGRDFFYPEKKIF